jgi:hypothetical protein
MAGFCTRIKEGACVAPRLFAALLAALLAVGGTTASLSACTAEQPGALVASPAAPPIGGFRTAASYDEIRECVIGGIDAAVEDLNEALASSEAAAAAHQAALDAGEDPDALKPPDPATAAAIEAARQQTGLAVTNPLIATVEEGLPTASTPMLRDERGYLYTANSGVIRVLKLDGAASELVASVGVYDYDGGSESVRMMSLVGTTLAVQCSVLQRPEDYKSPDYALAAYAAPRTTVLFFDMSKPEKPQYLRTLGVTGTGEAGLVRDGLLYIATRHATAPAASGGAWELEAAGGFEASGEAIKKALELRANDPISFVPSFYDDGNLTPLAPEQIYLPSEGSYATATVVACFDIEQNSCVSLFAVYNPAPVALYPACTWGDESLYLYWQQGAYDQATDRLVSTAHLARIALDGAAANGFAAYTSMDDVQVYPAFMKERNGQLQGALAHIGADYRRDWSFVAFDPALAVAGQLDGLGAGADLGSFCMIGDYAYSVTASAEQPFGVLDISDAAKPRLLGRSAFAEWPQKLAEAQDGVLLGYGSEAVREQVDRALLDPAQALPALDSSAFLRLYSLGPSAATAAALGDAVPIAALPEFNPDDLEEPAWTYEVQVYRDLGLVGVPLVRNDSTAKAEAIAGYAFFRIEAKGLKPATTLDLLDGEKALSAGTAAGYWSVLPSYDEANVYLVCYPFGTSLELSPKLLVLDRTTLEPTQSLPLM